MIPDNTASMNPITRYRLLLRVYDMVITSIKTNVDSQHPSLHTIAAAFEASSHSTPEATRLSFIAGVERLIAIDISFLHLLGILLPGRIRCSTDQSPAPCTDQCTCPRVSMPAY